MPPKTQFAKERILDAAFDLLREQGLEGITARNIAKKIGSSVGPIYSHFENINDLQDAALGKGIELLEDYSKRQWTDIPFLNMGVGNVCFARDEPILYSACCASHFSKNDLSSPDPGMMERMREDPMLHDLSDEDLKWILIKMSIFTHGLAVLASQDGLMDNSDQNIINLLYRTGGDIIFMAKVRSLAKDPKGNEDELSSIWRHIDGK